MATTRLAVRLAALGLVAASLVGVAGHSAAADPSERTKAAQSELERLTAEVEKAVEDYNEGRLELAKAERAAVRARGRVTAAEQQLRTAQGAVGSVAAAAYRSGSADEMLQLLTTVSEPGAFLNRASALDNVARSKAERVRDLRAARRELAIVQAEASRQYAAERAIQQRLTKTRNTITAAVARQEKVVARSVSADAKAAAARAAAEAAAAERARLQRLAAERERASRRAAANRARVARASRDTVRASDATEAEAEDDAADDDGADVPESGRAGAALSYAYAQIGKPYRWGGEGPGSFDCSGLTMRAWGAAGVSLPHSSRAQKGSGRRVSRSELRPGDLVFFGSPIHHVGIYIGGGQMINAPQSGELIGIRSAMRRDYAGAVRPG